MIHLRKALLASLLIALVAAAPVVPGFAANATTRSAQGEEECSPL